MPETSIQIHDTATRRKRPFEPIDPDNVRLYVCGPTVYDRAHLGNARPVLVFDVLTRLLRHVYGDTSVTYVRNFTDVDDKINATAVALKEGGAEATLEQLVASRSDETIRWYHEDMDALGALRPDVEPRATAYIAEMVAMIEELVAKGVAYEAEGHVLFSVSSDPEYGSLSGRSVDDMIAGARVEVAPFKRDPMDFVLWKPSDSALPGWDSPWGRGRPGWHIECSAMTLAILGEHFDIHGGGIDLTFPHHENEIAQSRSCGHAFANYWLHNEMLQVEGKKMSKSLGNFFTVRDLLEQGVPGEVIRLVMLGTHYRKPMDWTEAKRAEAEATLRGWMQVLERHGLDARMVAGLKAAGDWSQDAEFIGVLGNDLNTPGAIARLHVLAKNKTAKALIPFAAGLEMLGLINDWEAVAGWTSETEIDPQIDALVTAFLDERGEARASKDFARADAIRDRLAAAGVVVTDAGGVATWTPGEGFDPSKLEQET